MNRQAIIEKVKMKLDEYTPIDEGIGHPLDSYIDPSLNDAAIRLLKDAPLAKLNSTIIIGTEANLVFLPVPNDPNNRIVLFSCQGDVLRMKSIWLPQWESPVMVFYPYNSDMALFQHNPYTRAGIKKPVVIEQRSADGLKYTCYTHPEVNETNFSAECITKLKPEEIQDDLIEPLVYLAASMVASIMEMGTVATALYNEYAKILTS